MFSNKSIAETNGNAFYHFKWTLLTADLIFRLNPNKNEGLTNDSYVMMYIKLKFV